MQTSNIVNPTCFVINVKKKKIIKIKKQVLVIIQLNGGKQRKLEIFWFGKDVWYQIECYKQVNAKNNNAVLFNI